MKKELGILFLLVLVAGFVNAEIAYGEIVAKIDDDATAIFHVLDTDTEERTAILTVTDYGTGVVSAEMNVPDTQAKIRIFLLDKETKTELRTWTQGPIDTSQDLQLDLRGGILQYLELEEINEEESNEKINKQSQDQPTTTAEETTNKQGSNEETIGITGNVAGDGSTSTGNKFWSSGATFIVLLGILILTVIHMRNKSLIANMPEEKELLAMQKQAKTKHKALGKMKTEEKMKRKIETQKRKTAVKLAKEDAELGQINKEGNKERAKEAERYDKKSGAMY